MNDAAIAEAPKYAESGSRLAKHAGAHAQQRAYGNWMRADYVRSRGHRTYIQQAKRCERFYLGAGLQWEPNDVFILAGTGRKPVEDNQIMQMVNTAIGYQIANRMDITVRPRGRGADDESALVMGKTIKFVADDTLLHWRETEVFGNGMIMQRGYFDIRMSFENNALGEIDTKSLDPLDVMPDPDARAYDPEEWGDVTVDRWYTLDQIEQLFGKPARDAFQSFEAIDQYAANVDIDGYKRNRFGSEGISEMPYYSELAGSEQCGLYHVIDRQYRTYELTLCAVWPTGDIHPIPNATKEQRAAYVAQGCLLVKRMHKRVKWMVSGRCVSLFDDYSPYPWFTIVPFFPYFRGGVTRGMVDNAISMQEVLNKGLSQFGHILNTVANSGWIIQQNSLVDMTAKEFEEKAAKNGLILEYKEGAAKPEKIQPSSVPTGIVEFIAHAKAAISSATGMDETLTSSGPVNEMSGVAYQARQYAAQQKLAVPLDNLGRTRHMVAHRYIDLIQMFYDTPRIIRITEHDEYGAEQTSELAINQPIAGEDGLTQWLNDLTMGEYDLVISEQPMQITFDNSQFSQLESLAKNFGYIVPPAVALKYSSLAEKSEVAKAIESASAARPDPLEEAKVRLTNAQIEKLISETVNKRIEAIYGATQAGAQIATIPQTAALSDEILQSAGFDDQNAAPIVPGVPDPGNVGAGLTAAAPAEPLVAPADDHQDPTDPSTNPLTPENPGAGIDAGLEAPGAQ